MTSAGNKLYGLILAAGKSSRMGTDKGLLNYHGIPQRAYLYKLLEEFCDKTFMSIREDQLQEFTIETNVVIDENQCSGPFNGLLSAYHFDTDATWLVLACDLPLIDKQAIELLVSSRNTSKYATAYMSSKNSFPEPLCAIWEPKGLKAIGTFLAEGNLPSPVNFLLNNDVEIVKPTEDDVLLNANSKEEHLQIINKLKKIE